MKWFSKKVKTTGHVIDMTKRTWGHNISLSKVGKNTMDFSIWVSCRPQVGDEMLWESKHGVVRGRVFRVESAPTVWDMYFITVDNVRLNDD